MRKQSGRYWEQTLRSSHLYFVRDINTTGGKHIVHRTVFFYSQLSCLNSFFTINIAGQPERQVYRCKHGRYRISPLSFDQNLYIRNLLTLFLQDTDQVEGTAGAQCHKYQFHRPYTGTLSANIGRTVNMYLYR